MAEQTWESCIYTAEEERDFVKNYLGPALWKDGLKDKKIIIWDHNRSFLYHRASVVLDDPSAAKYVWGSAIIGMWATILKTSNASKKLIPNAHLLFTEGCNGPFDFSKINDWQWGELYGKSMINDLNNGV